MEAQPTSLITRLFDDIETIDDPRADNARHFLTDILVIAILAVMCLTGKNETQTHRRYFISSLACDTASDLPN